LEVSSEQN